MGCGASKKVEEDSLREQRGKQVLIKMPFPLSLYQKTVLKDTWIQIRPNELEFGRRIFIKWFELRPEMIAFFPEFQNSTDSLYSMKLLSGHPKKVTRAIDEAIDTLDDGDIFITKMERLGMKHSENNLQPEFLKALGQAIMSTLEEMLGKDQWRPEVRQAWYAMYKYICSRMLKGLDSAKENKLR